MNIVLSTVLSKSNEFLFDRTITILKSLPTFDSSMLLWFAFFSTIKILVP